jgi:hypothetical protein
MAGCCPSRDYHRFFNQRFARRLATRYRKRGLDPTAQTMVQFLRQLDLEGASVLEIGGGVGEIELLQAGGPGPEPGTLSRLRATGAHAGRAGWRPGAVRLGPPRPRRAPWGGGAGDLVVLHRVVCCYPDYERLLGAAADHAQRALVFSYPPRNPLSRAFYRGFNLVMRLTRSSFRGFAHPPDAMLEVLEDRGLRRTYQGRSRIWQVAGLEGVS